MMKKGMISLPSLLTYSLVLTVILKSTGCYRSSNKYRYNIEDIEVLGERNAQLAVVERRHYNSATFGNIPYVCSYNPAHSLLTATVINTHIP